MTKNKDIFCSMADLLREAAEREFQEAFRIKMEGLEAEIKRKTDEFVANAKNEATLKAKTLAIRLMEDPNFSGITLSVRFDK